MRSKRRVARAASASSPVETRVMLGRRAQVELEVLDVEALAETRILLQGIGVVGARDQEQLAHPEGHELPEDGVLEGQIVGRKARVGRVEVVHVGCRLVGPGGAFPRSGSAHRKAAGRRHLTLLPMTGRRPITG